MPKIMLYGGTHSGEWVDVGIPIPHYFKAIKKLTPEQEREFWKVETLCQTAKLEIEEYTLERLKVVSPSIGIIDRLLYVLIGIPKNLETHREAFALLLAGPPPTARSGSWATYGLRLLR